MLGTQKKIFLVCVGRSLFYAPWISCTLCFDRRTWGVMLTNNNQSMEV